MPKLKALAVSVASIVVLLAMTACGGLTARPTQQTLTVMTYNVYVGAPPDELLEVMSLTDAPPKVAKFYQDYLASDFPGRAAAIAKIIKKSEPHIIGLQEISLVRTQDPADFPPAAPNATDVEQDFLEVLMMKLKDEGLDYKEAGKVETFDLEMPRPTNTEGTAFIDIRLTDHDVILVRSDVDVSNVTAAKYKAELPVESLGLKVPRGYVAIDATVDGVKYRVVNTHLEHFVPAVRLGQTQELIASLKDEKLPVILMGDFNTKAPDGAAYQAIVAAGYTDMWQSGDGYTCCQADDLKNAMSELGMGDDDGRIDLIFTKGAPLRRSATITTYTVGDKAEDKSARGLWPSDHAGVVAELPIVR